MSLYLCMQRCRSSVVLHLRWFQSDWCCLLTMTSLMEVVQTDEFYILLKDEHSLWFSRADGSAVAGNSWDLADADAPECLGRCEGLVGRVQTHIGGEHYLLMVRDSESVGTLTSGHEVRKVTRVSYLSLSPAGPPDLAECQLRVCPKHVTASAADGAAVSESRVGRTWGMMRDVTSRVTSATVSAAQNASAQVRGRVASGLRRSVAPSSANNIVLDEILKMFNDSDSFYFTVGGGDISSSLQRRVSGHKTDHRFLWNAGFADCFQAGSDLNPTLEAISSIWLLPLIHGFFQSVDVPLKGSDDDEDVAEAPRERRRVRLTVISRRCRHRAGTRYRRRGVDPEGHVANYVETEQILSCGKHHLSFVQARGSVPVFWSQPGYKYRPPPRIDRDPVETHQAFSRHMDQELSRYGALHLVNLVDQQGREKPIGDAYLDQVLMYDSPCVTYTAFDFHEHCRGMRFENVAVLVGYVSEHLEAAGFTWADQHGSLRDQQAVFRINCIDCLDRTNVVQTALARCVLERQFSKLGVLTPDCSIPQYLRSVFQEMWADNGDVISRQYAGTSALKGDFTRTGERRLAGLMKDGVNSANRYYLNRFRDAGRQAGIEALLGRPLPSATVQLTATVAAETVGEQPDGAAADDVEDEEQEDVERVRQLLQESRLLLVSDQQRVLGTWPMIDADPATCDFNDQELDTILVLTCESYVVANYDDATDRLVSFQSVPLTDLVSVELGMLEPGVVSGAGGGAIGRRLLLSASTPRLHGLRLNYTIGDQPGYYHQLRPTQMRFFNSVALPVDSEEQRVEALRAVVETFRGACSADQQLCVSFSEPHRLDRRRSRQINNAPPRRRFSLLGWQPATSTLRQAGNRALSSVSTWLPRLFDGTSSLQQPTVGGAVTQRNSPVQSRPLDVDGGDLLVGSAGIIACTAPAQPPTLIAPASLQQTSGGNPAEGSDARTLGSGGNPADEGSDARTLGSGGNPADEGSDARTLGSGGNPDEGSDARTLGSGGNPADEGSDAVAVGSGGNPADEGSDAVAVGFASAGVTAVPRISVLSDVEGQKNSVGRAIGCAGDEDSGGVTTSADGAGSVETEVCGDCVLGESPNNEKESGAAGMAFLGAVLTPLTSPARETVLGSFSLIARGVQKLTPSASSSTSSTNRQLEMSDLMRQRIAGSRTKVTII